MISNWTTNPARMVIAAPQGRSGKTTVALGVCSAFRERGFKVQPFKKGPDYIDPSWLSAAAGIDCRSLDPFFVENEENIQRAFLRGAIKADLSVIEGNHGLYDSLYDDGFGSTAYVARSLQAPVILVVNSERMSRSVAAMVSGYQNFEPQTPIAGVVLNRVAKNRHETKLRRAIESYCHIPVLGAIPWDSGVVIPDRHLGLIPQSENDSSLQAIDACRRVAEKYLDLNGLMEIAQSARVVDWKFDQQNPSPKDPIAFSGNIRIGIVRDRAFTFYYPENFEALKREGAELVFVNSFLDHSLPDVHALIIGGGFPEIFLDELNANQELITSIRYAIDGGMPVYAECGGLMYLAEKITYKGKSKELTGVLACDVYVEDRPQGHGYVIAEVSEPNPFFQTGTHLRGHEFHHSKISQVGQNLTMAYHLTRGTGIQDQRDALIYKNVLAAYTHIHADGSPAWAEGIVRAARLYQQGLLHG